MADLVKGCQHCDTESLALQQPLFVTDTFWVVCDIHPLIEGHILIIPKKHISCFGALTPDLFSEFESIYQKVCRFQSVVYDSYAVFEHGVMGQTVFHAHMHFLPFSGNLNDVVPEKDAIKQIESITELPNLYKRRGKYLFVQQNSHLYTVDPSIGKPRFFRDRFASALGHPERGDWKQAAANPQLQSEFREDINKLEEKWKLF